MPEDNINTSLENRIILALEAAPWPEIPADFAARVSAQLPAPTALVLSSGRYGQRAAFACLVLLLLLIFAIANRAPGTSMYWISIESIFCAQFVLLAVWLATSPSSF